MQIFRPVSYYIHPKYEALATRLAQLYPFDNSHQDSYTLFETEYGKTVLYYDMSFGIPLSCGEDEILDLILKVEVIANEVVPGFRYKLPEPYMKKRVLLLLQRHEKCGAEPTPGEEQLINDLMKLIL